MLGSSRLLGMALHSLRAMSGGGMWDVVGGGFHRYSVDELWCGAGRGGCIYK